MESQAKLELGSGMHSVYTHFPKDPNCDICLKTKMTRAYCRRRAGTVVPRAEILVTWWLQITIFSVKEVNRVIISDTLLWYKIWQLSGCNFTRAKQNIIRKHKGACKSSWSQIGNRKSFTRTIPWNLARLVRNYPGFIVRQRHTDQKQMGLQKEQCAEWKKGHLRYWCNQSG